MLTCGLYCLLRFPETSSAHGMTRRLKTGLPFATARTGFGPKSFQTVNPLSGDVPKFDVPRKPPCPNVFISGYVNCNPFAGIRTISFFLTRYFPFCAENQKSTGQVFCTTHTLTKVDRVAFGTLFPIDHNPPLGENILPRFSVCNFVDVEVSFWRIFPVCPHWG